MGIEDIQISEELETNAPSIKYSGNEGPKSPQEMEQMMMAQLEEEYSKYVNDMLEQGLEPMSLEQFLDQAMAEGQMSGGNPLPQDPTKPVNPFQPKPTGPALPDRQMAAYGGIMGLDGRKQYGLGSKLKKTIRNIIPNEVAEIAVKAAPFVAPFNPIAAGLMAGVGGFDQTGRIGSSLKSGLLTYGGGQLARGIGGGMGNLQTGFNPAGGFGSASTFGKGFLSNPLQGEGGLSALLNKTKAPADMSKFNALGPGGSNPANIAGANQYGVSTTGDASIAESLAKKVIPQAADVASKTEAGGILNTIKKFALDNKLLLGLAAGTIGASALMGNMEPDEIQDMQRGEGLDIEGIRTEVIEAFKDETGEKLAALRTKYPFLGTQRSKNIDAMGKAMGGRIGFSEGSKDYSKDPNYKGWVKTYETNPDAASMNENHGTYLSFYNRNKNSKAEGGIMDLGGMEKDYRNTGGFVDLGAKEKADDVPARLSVNEFVFTADAVRNAGGGDIDQGAEVMENMMKHLEQGGQVSEESQGMAGARDMFATSQRLSEVI